ncbi:MAG: tetratricopeptide repeat protein [Planctomycetaceae bacterium]
MRIQITPKTVRRLMSADGYLDLDMPEKAIAELECMPESTVLDGPRHLLMGIALKTLDRHPEAISHLERAARIMPSPVRRFAWQELTDSYKAVGSEQLAAMASQLAGDVQVDLQISVPFSPVTLNLSKSKNSLAK